MLKIFCDVLPDYMDNVTPPTKGLGLLKSDSAIFGIICVKTFVDREEEKGIEFAIYDENNLKMDFSIDQRFG